MKPASIRIGTGAGYAGDRIDPAVDLAARGKLDYLVFECLAERTIALAQLRRQTNANAGYDPMLEERMRAVLGLCQQNGITIISNMGAANPLAAAQKTAEIARELGLKDLKIAAVLGDDVLDLLEGQEMQLLESGAPLASIREQVVSANAYLGVEGILQALTAGADVVLTGRVADPALFLAPLIHEFGWSRTNYPLLGQGTTLGHLLECGGQVTGGYFADPGYKEVPRLAELGFPIAEVQADGHFVISKLPDTGGLVSVATCKEQLLYEVHDPAAYLTPDVVADFTKVQLTPAGHNQIAVSGGTGRMPTGLLKVSVGYRAGFMGEGQISYGGANALARAQLAIDIVRARLKKRGIQPLDLRCECMGLNHLYGDTLPSQPVNEVRLRIAAHTNSRSAAQQIGKEVESLYTNGPAGGGGVTQSVEAIIAIQSVLLPATIVQPRIKVVSYAT